jgi:hypothetical protein
MGSNEQNDTALPLPSSDSAGQRFRLDGEQSRVYEILRDNIHLEIAAMYEACVILLATFEHDEKLPLAAHALREVFRHTPEKLRVRWPRRQLKNELLELREKYVAWHPGFAEGGKLPEANPQQDTKLLAFLRCYENIAKYEGGSRREQATKVFECLMPWAKTAPLQDFARRWVGVYSFLDEVAHHDQTTETEFAAQLTEFQVCLLATLKPEAVADLDAIDELLGKGEANGQP